jgi:very-short-patch-repair endonuclease/prophage antirepressor-like protein
MDTIQNENKCELQEFKDGNTVYFTVREIGNLLGYKSHKKIIYHVSQENKIYFENFTGEKPIKLQKTSLLINLSGLQEIINSKSTIVSLAAKQFLQTKYNLIFEEEHKIDDIIVYEYIKDHIYHEYFIGEQIATLLGYKNTTKTITNIVDKCDRMNFREFDYSEYCKYKTECNEIPNVKQSNMTILINRQGIQKILLQTKKLITFDAEVLLKKFNINVSNVKYLSKEQNTLSEIEKIFKTESIQTQYQIGSYFIDLYFPKYKLIVECDERGHFDRDPKKELERFNFINKQLDIDFNDQYYQWIRYNPDLPDFDITKVISSVYRSLNYLKHKEIHEQKMMFLDIPTEIFNSFKTEKIQRNYEFENKENFKPVDLYFPEYKLMINCISDTSKRREDFINVFLDIPHLESKQHWVKYNKDTHISYILSEIYEKLQKLKDKFAKKQCLKCGIYKDITEFQKNGQYKSGHKSMCKVCDFKIRDDSLKKLQGIPERRTCIHCNVEKDNDDFTLNHIYVCKECYVKHTIQRKNEPKIKVDFKKCSTCTEEFPASNFFKNNMTKDGLDGQCKICKMKRVRKCKELKEIKIPDRKICNRCNVEKDSSSFYKNKNGKDGLWNFCKECDKKSTAARLQEQGVDLTARNRSYRQNKLEKNKDVPIPDKKICKDCNIEKNSSEFYRDKICPDGLISHCKACFKIRYKSREDSEPKEIKEKLSLAEQKRRYKQKRLALYETVIIPETKVCMDCNIEKNSSEFYRDKTSLNGLFSHCKECASIRYKNRNKN